MFLFRFVSFRFVLKLLSLRLITNVGFSNLGNGLVNQYGVGTMKEIDLIKTYG